MRISDWSSDVCSSDLTVSGSRQKQAIILEDEQRVARRGGLAKQMFLAEVDAACADRCEAPGIGGPYRAEKGHPRVARQPDASEFAVHRSPTVGALREVDAPDCIEMIANRHDSI